MSSINSQINLPENINNADGEVRKVGVEIEFAGILPVQIAKTITEHFGGHVSWTSPFELTVEDTQLGTFIVEMDSDFVKRHGKGLPMEVHAEDAGADMELQLMQWLSRVVGELVPWELVTAPIPLDQLHLLLPLLEDLRAQGAKGTRHAVQYAFGVHLNPELPALDANTILRHLRAYFCLYEAIAALSKIDLARKLTPYIKHFDKKYIAHVVNPDYQPTIDQLIDDYLAANPTRNRSLDMLPLFAHIDERRVKAVVSDSRVKSRPTFHYRLPNCDIDNKEWNLHQPWNHWVKVETLASDLSRLNASCEIYAGELKRITHSFEKRWSEQAMDLFNAL